MTSDKIDKMSNENIQLYNELVDYINTYKDEYINKYFAISSHYYLPLNEGLEQTTKVTEFLDKLKTRTDVIGKILDLQVHIEDLDCILIPFPGVRITYENDKKIVFSAPIFFNNLIIKDTLEEAQNTLNLIQEVGE